MRTNKELLIGALQELVNEIGAAPVEQDRTRWCRITAGTFHRATSALMAVRKPRSPYQKRDTRYPPASGDAGSSVETRSGRDGIPGDGQNERPTEPVGER